MRLIEFTVTDNVTGQAPDLEKIALTEEWAKRLIYCDIDCFAITEDGNLILIDDCNNIAYPPADRFTVAIDPESLRPQGEWHIFKDEEFLIAECPNCGMVVEATQAAWWDYCPNCGAKMKGETK